MSKIKIGIALAMVGSLIVLGYLYRVELQRGAQQAATIVQQRAELSDRDRRIEDLARQREAAEQVAAREKARATEIREEARELRYEIKQIQAKNAVLNDWLLTNYPADIYRILRANADDSQD